MDQVSDDWLDWEIKNGMNPKGIDYALKELQARRKAEKEQGDMEHREEQKNPAEAKQEREKAILPIPCTVGVKGCTVKQWFQKVNEELDELKTEILRTADIDDKTPHLAGYPPCFLKIEGMRYISEEAADTITAITSMLEAMGIDEGMRQEAQRWVNERNAERKRL